MEQQRIWDHFQTESVQVFGHAAGRYAAMERAVRRHGRGGGRVLNIGIGSGALEQRLLAGGFQVASLDPGQASVERAARLGVDARCGRAEAMPFDDASFAVVVASEVLEHIEPATRALVLREVARVLVPGGHFVGSVPYREVLADQEVICPDCGKVFHRWGHVSSFDLPGLQGELAREFEAVACRRRAFVDWAGARSPMQLAKNAAQALLGRLGEPIASPSIAFEARRRAAR